MMKMIAKTGLAALALGVVSVASAQTSGPTGISARLGAVWPSGGGDTLLGIGFDYKFQSVPVEPARGAYWSYLGATIDYYGNDSDNFNVPVALTYNVRNNQLTFAAGISYNFLRFGGGEEHGIGAVVSAGYDFGDTATPGTTPFFVQAKYFFTPESDANAFGVYAGFRF